jgi:uncharacterized protein involved in exopolysaccharide biosynthesis
MKGPDSKTSTGLSDLEATVSLSPETGEIMAGGQEVQQDPGEYTTHESTIASLRLLWESRRFLGRVTGIGLLLTAVITLLLPRRFQSKAELMPPDNQSTSSLAAAAAALGGGAVANLGGIASQLLGLKSTSDLLVGVLASRTAEDKLIQQFDLKKVYGVSRMEDARKILEARTDVSVDRKSQIITIAVTDSCGLPWGCESPKRAQAMAQAYIDELNRLVAEVSTSSARRERIFLEERLKSVNEDLEAAERDFSQFASKNSAIDIKEQGKAMVDAAATLEGQYIAARSELEGLRQIYADSNVRVRTTQARVAELESQLRKVGGENGGTPSGSATSLDSLYPSIRELPLLGVPYADLYRKTKVQEAVFETLTQEYELAKVQEAKEIPTVKVLDPPNLPERKSFPPRTLLTLLGTVLAFAGGVTWVLGRTRWEQVDATDPGKVLAQEVFDTVRAAIPWSSRNGYQNRPKPDVAGNPETNGRVRTQKDSG